MNELAEHAFTLAEEIHEGRWDHIPSIHFKPASACPEIIEELRKRSPGHSLEQYQAALAQALHDAK